jgi:hypothetical protein
MTLDSADYTSSLNALSKLKALEKFIFSYQDQRRTNNDNFMNECLRKFPSLKYVGNELPMYNISDYIIPHNFHVFKNDKEVFRFGFEQIVMYHYIPKNCYLPNLQGISLICHLYSNHQGIAKFTNVTELGLFGDCYGSPDILQIMGNQLTTLRMCLRSVCVSFIFNCCKKLKYLYISVQHVENSDELWSPESIKNLETFVFKAEMQLSLPNLFLYRVMQAPNLKFLEIYNAIMRIDETKQAISDVQNGTILQNLVKFRFHRIKMFQHIDDYSATLVRKLLVCCAAYCPKLIEASLGHCNIVDGVLGPELMRMESLCSSM